MFKAYSEYKQSGLPWLDVVPAHWEFRRIKPLFYIINGATPDSGTKDYWDGDVCWITPADLSGETKYITKSSRTITEKGFASCSTKTIPANNIVMATRAPIGNVRINAVDLCTNQGCKGLVSKTDNSVLYFFYLLSNFEHELQNLGDGATFMELSNTKLSNFVTLLPTRPEQDQIVRFLDSKLSKIAKLINAKKKQITLLKEQKQAIINKAVTKGLNDNAKMKPGGVEWLGEIPAEWEWLMLSQVCSEQQIKNTDNTDNTDNKVLSLSYGKIIPKKDIDFGLVPLKYDGYQIVDEGDIILRLTDLQNDHKSLRTGLVKERGIITSAYTCLKPKHNSAFLQFLLQCPQVKKKGG